jgi:NAD kinase
MQPREPTNTRAVIITRRTPLELLLERHGTMGQVEFFLTSRQQSLAPYREAHDRLQDACKRVESALPSEQRRARVDRDELDRFLFSSDDIILIVGQDGLVANVAKYLKGQPVIAINPDPSRYDGVLCTHRVRDAAALYSWLQSPQDAKYAMQDRTLALAQLDDGQRLLALNEVFVGHRSHQSARYRISASGTSERHSSSGIICSTGTGCTGWARSIAEQRGIAANLPLPPDRKLSWFVREPFPSVATQTSLTFGVVDEQTSLIVDSEMSEGGVLFGDGIETDRIEFPAGSRLQLQVAEQSLRLVVPAQASRTQH